MIEKRCKIGLTVKTSNSRSQTCSVNKGLLKISQNSQKNTSARADLLKKCSSTGAFLWILGKLDFFVDYIRMTDSGVPRRHFLKNFLTKILNNQKY